MKTFKIRFVEFDGQFSIQQKTVFGWMELRYVVDMGYGSVSYLYSAKTKEEVLAEVLEKRFKIDKRFAKIIEYPGLKIY